MTINHFFRKEILGKLSELLSLEWRDDFVKRVDKEGEFFVLPTDLISSPTKYLPLCKNIVTQEIVE